MNKSRKQIKERKNRTKKIRGVKKNAGACIILGLLTEQRGRPLSSTLGSQSHCFNGSTHPAALPAMLASLLPWLLLSIVHAQHMPQQPEKTGHEVCEVLM